MQTFTEGLISSIRVFITSVFLRPTVFTVAIIWRFMLLSQTLSASIKSNAPTPLRARASQTYPPTPPMPNTATRAFLNLSIAASPKSRLVRSNQFSIVPPESFTAQALPAEAPPALLMRQAALHTPKGDRNSPLGPVPTAEAGYKAFSPPQSPVRFLTSLRLCH